MEKWERKMLVKIRFGCDNVLSHLVDGFFFVGLELFCWMFENIFEKTWISENLNIEDFFNLNKKNSKLHEKNHQNV